MEKSLMQRIQECELTKSQIKIANFIFKNQKRVLGLTAKELGKETGLSDASIIRFARVIGFDGYNDLKEEIEREIRNNSEKIGKHSLFDRFVMQTEKYRYDDNGTEVLPLMVRNLEASFRQNSSESYKQISDFILHARKKVIIGLRGGKGCALQFGRLLGHIVNGVEVILDESHDRLCELSELGENDIVIFLNFPRYYKVDIKIGKVLEKQKVPMVLITDNMTSPVARYARYVLLAETEHCGFFHSMLGVQGILEYLMLLMCYQEPEVFREKLKDRDEILEEYRIL